MKKSGCLAWVPTGMSCQTRQSSDSRRLSWCSTSTRRSPVSQRRSTLARPCGKRPFFFLVAAFADAYLACSRLLPWARRAAWRCACARKVQQDCQIKKAISARWTSAFSYEKMSNRCLGPMDALPRAHSSGQGLGWLEPEGATPVPKLSVCRCDPCWDCCKKGKCLPPASEAMRAVFAWAVLGLLRPCAAQWLWHVRAGTACGKWIHAPERLCTSCRRACTVSWYSEHVFHLFEGKRHGNYCRSGAKRQPARS